VNPETQGGLLILTGGVVGRMALAGTYLLYVREGMRFLLLSSAGILVVLGATRVWSALYGGDAGTASGAAAGQATAGHDDHDGAHHAPRVAWLLVVPVLAVVLIAPSPLGSFTAARQSAATPVAAPTSDNPFPPLPKTAEAFPLPVLEFVERALFDDQRSLDGVTVKLVGMVSPAEGGGEDFRLTRFMIACCAADGQAIQVAVHGAARPLPPTDSWVEVVGKWRAPPTGTTPEDQDAPPLDLIRMRSVPRPAIPYE
jgi:uncharacterized repeat protein (TIGR03943 family)